MAIGLKCLSFALFGEGEDKEKEGKKETKQKAEEGEKKREGRQPTGKMQSDWWEM